MKILDVKIDNISYNDALNFAEKSLKENKTIKIYTPNPEIVLRARKDTSFKKILNSSDLLLADGVGLLYLSLFSKSRIKERIPGSDFFISLCFLAEKNKYSIFLLGGRNNVALKTKEFLEKKFKDINIVGVSEDINCFELIKKLQPDIIFVALGAPKQEKWIHKNISKFPNTKIMMSVGGAFDMYSNDKKRAPLFLRKIGLEWLWRFLIEPKRYKRTLNAVFVFPLTVLIDSINKKYERIKNRNRMRKFRR